MQKLCLIIGRYFHLLMMWGLFFSPPPDRFASTRNPFECKDIKIALTEIRELQDDIEELQRTKNDQIK